MTLNKLVLVHNYSIRINVIRVITEKAIFFCEHIHKMIKIPYFLLKYVKLLTLGLQILGLLNLLRHCIQLLIKMSGLFVGIFQAALL